MGQCATAPRGGADLRGVFFFEGGAPKPARKFEQSYFHTAEGRFFHGSPHGSPHAGAVTARAPQPEGGLAAGPAANAPRLAKTFDRMRRAGAVPADASEGVAAAAGPAWGSPPRAAKRDGGGGDKTDNKA